MDPVHQVTIIPRGMAGGFTMQLPTEDKYYATKGEMLQELIVLLGGRVSEEINLDDISTGASNDLERVTSLARSMVTKYGMSSKLGPLTFDSSDEVFLGNSIGHSRQYSEEVASEIDVEVRKIVVDAYEKTREILKSNQERLDYIAKALLEYETLNDKQFEEAFEMRLSLGQNDKSEEDSTPEKTANDSKPVISEDTGSENRMPASQDLVNEDKATILQDLACDDNTVSEDRIDEE
jgi:ATP-dependent zinc metalloprotease ftsH 2